MKSWTLSSTHSVWSFRQARVVFLGLLVIAATCVARQTPAGPTRRERASKLAVIQLPEPSTSSAVSVEQALLGLRNLEAPGNQRLELAKISQLAWAMQGATTVSGADLAGSATPLIEAAALRVYFILPDGLYLYNPVNHSLQQINNDDVREALSAALLNRTGGPIGGCQVVVVASVQDFTRRYGGRARTILALQAGRMSQRLQLEAVAQGLTFVSIDAIDMGDVRRVTRIPRTFEPVYVAFVGYPVGQAPSSTASGHVSEATALLVVPPQGYQEEELLATRRDLEQGGVQVMIASVRMGVLTGMRGGAVRADLLLNQANLDDFNAVVFIGGIGVIDYLNNPVVLGLVRKAVTQRKVLAAIGTAPSILANAGALRGARATAYISEQARIIQGGARYTGNPVEQDGLTITATGPLAVPLFARSILDALSEARQITTPPSK